MRWVLFAVLVPWLLVAIRAHRSAASTQFDASEANQVIRNFNQLSPSEQQDILNFLRSL